MYELVTFHHVAGHNDEVHRNPDMKQVLYECRYKKLPFEANPACWDAIPDADARSLVQSLLKTKPQERATATALLASSMLAGMELLTTQE